MGSQMTVRGPLTWSGDRLAQGERGGKKREGGEGPVAHLEGRQGIEGAGGEGL